jgi:crotonobetainyl-CoA:carnitine CoA-transferase CaiB-like acyl-CoA transferase
VADRLAAALAARPRAAALEALMGAGVPATPVLRSLETLDDPWLQENHYQEGWEHPRLGT